MASVCLLALVTTITRANIGHSALVQPRSWGTSQVDQSWQSLRFNFVQLVIVINLEESRSPGVCQHTPNVLRTPEWISKWISPNRESMNRTARKKIHIISSLKELQYVAKYEAAKSTVLNSSRTEKVWCVSLQWLECSHVMSEHRLSLIRVTSRGLECQARTTGAL